MRKALMRDSTLRDALAFGRPLLAGLFMLGVAGCTSMSADEAAQPPADGSAAAIPPPSSNESFPNLGSVPDQAPAVPSAAERQTVIEGLSSDRSHAHYTDQELNGNTGGAALAPPEPAPAPEIISTEPAPEAAPTQPVETLPETPSEEQPEAAAPTEDQPASATPSETQPLAEPPAPEPSSSEATPDASAPAAAEATTVPPASEPLTQASSAMTAPPPAAPAADGPPPPEPQVAAVPAPAAAVPATSEPTAPSTASMPSQPASAGVPLPGQPGTVVPPVNTAMPSTLPAPSTMPAQPAITAEPIASPPMPAATAMPAMPPATTVASGVPSGPFPYQSASSRPATYASGAVTVDMSAIDGGGAQPYYPASLANAYAPPAYSQPAAYAPGPGAGGPAGMIYFGEGAAGLDASDRAVLQSVAAIYRQRGGYIRLVGHASQDGGGAADFAAQQANLQLSWARANAVARELARQGVDPGAIETAAVGDSQPAYVESSATGEAANRRVEIYLVY